MSASIKVNIGDVLMNGMMDVISKVVMDLSRMYNFDGVEACRMMEIEKSSKSVKSVKPSKSLKVVKVKSSFPLPFNGDQDMSCCQGLRQNQGLYTQCQGSRKDSGEFCKVCQSQADKNDNGKPDYGTIGDRMKAHVEGVEFKDPSGKLPTAYSIVMKKLKLSREQVEEEAGKLNIKLNPIHFEEVASKKSGRPAKGDKPEKTETKPKGRPKKSKKVLELAGEEEDLFASLVMSANAESNAESNSESNGLNTPILAESDDEEEQVEKEIEEQDEKQIEDPSVNPIEEPIKKQKKNKISEEEKASLAALAKQKKQEIEDEKAALAKQKKQEMEDEKALAKQKKKAMEDEKTAKKKAIEDEKALAKQKKKAIEDEKALAKEKGVSKKSSKKEKAAATEEEEPDVVKKIEFEGKKYLKSKNTGIIYNMEQDVIGKWNEEKQRIDFNEVGEESEDEYDEDDN